MIRQMSNAIRWHAAMALTLALFGLGVPLPVAAQLKIVVRADHPMGPVNPNIFGNNISWVQNADNMWDAKQHAFYPEDAKALRDLHAPLIRYPGGLYGNQFHWATSLPHNRRAQGRADSDTWEMPDFGTMEFYQASEQFGFVPMFIFNLSNGTPEEAAALVAYLNGQLEDDRPIGKDAHGEDWRTVGEWARQRAADGHPASFHARYFELGNENWNTAREGGQTVATYIKAAVATDIAVKRIDPTVRTAAVAYHQNKPGTLDGAAGATQPWNESLLDGLQNSPGHTINAIVNHYYTSTQGMTPPDRYAAEVLTEYVLIEAGLDAFIHQVHERYTRQPTEIWWTEWARSAIHINDHNLQDALYTADIGLNTYGTRPEITIGNYFDIGDGGRGMFFAGNGIHRPYGTVVRFPEFEAASLILKTLKGVRVATETQAPTFARPDRGNPPQVRVLAALDGGERMLRLFIVNKANYALAGLITLEGCTVGGPIRMHQVGGSGLDYGANNFDPQAPRRVAEVEHTLPQMSSPLRLEIPGPAFVVLEIPIGTKGN